MRSSAPLQSLQTSVTWRRSNSVRNSAIMVASAGRERVVQEHHRRPVAAGVGAYEAVDTAPPELHSQILSPVGVETTHC